MAYKFGAFKSPPDHRDYIYGQMIPLGAVPEIFLLDETPVVRDQGKYGTCVGQAAAGIKDWQETKNYRRGVQTSPLFVYSECKKIDGIPDKEGTYPRDAMKVLKTLGVCKESVFPYELLTSSTPPDTTPQAREEAKEFVIGAYAQVQTLAEIKQALTRSGPVMGALLVATSFLEPEPGGFVPMPEGSILGGHAIVVTGWDDTLKHTYKKPHMGKTTFQGFLRVRNSWGASWGDNGYCWIPYEFFSGRLDIGAPYWMESWTSVDVVLPVPGARRIIIVPGKNFALVDGDKVQIDQPAVIDPKTSRTLIPLRFIAENMGWKVTWDGKQVVMAKEG